MVEENEVRHQEKSTKRIILEYSISFGALLILSIAIGLMRYYLYYAKQASFLWITYFGDVLTIVGVFGALFWALLLVSKGGAFDMIVYGTKKFVFAIFRRNPLSGLPRTYSEYVVEKRIKRGEDRFYYLLFVSLFYFAIGLILLIIRYTVK